MCAASPPPPTSAPFPVAEQAGRERLSLPLYPELTAEQQQRVVDELFAALDER